jgi:glucokinase
MGMPASGDRRAMQVVGVDVGGTKTAFGLVAFPAAQIIRRLEMSTPQGKASHEPFLEEVGAAIRTLVADDGCDAIGIGVCELVSRSGEVGSAHRVHWMGLPVQAHLRDIAPTIVEADVRAQALAECHWGAGQDYRDLIYLNIGTGISTCFVKDRVPHAGANGHALAIAMSPIHQSCPACGSRSSYVLEDVAGGAGLIALYERATGRAVASAADVIAAAVEGDVTAARLVAEAGSALGVTLGIALNMLDPEALIIGGGLGGRDGPYWQAMTTSIRGQVWSARTRALPILPGALGADAGLIGAAAAAWFAMAI